MDAGYAFKLGKEVEYRRIGIKTVSGIVIKGKPEFAKKFATMVDTNARAELRSKRCLVPDGKGGYIRCPGNNSCEYCKKKDDISFSTNIPISLDSTEDGSSIDVPDEVSVEEIVLQRILLSDLINHLKSMPDKRPYEILSLILEGYSIQKISNELGLPWSTTKDQYNKIIEIGKDLFQI